MQGRARRELKCGLIHDRSAGNDSVCNTSHVDHCTHPDIHPGGVQCLPQSADETREAKAENSMAEKGRNAKKTVSFNVQAETSLDGRNVKSFARKYGNDSGAHLQGTSMVAETPGHPAAGVSATHEKLAAAETISILIGDHVSDMVPAAYACGILPAHMRTYSTV